MKPNPPKQNYSQIISIFNKPHLLTHYLNLFFLDYFTTKKLFEHETVFELNTSPKT